MAIDEEAACPAEFEEGMNSTIPHQLNCRFIADHRRPRPEAGIRYPEGMKSWRTLMCLAATWFVALPLCAQNERPPDTNAQQSMLARITEHALHSQDQLPDFICTQLTTRSEDRSKKGNRWKKLDTLEVEFSFIGRHPRWKLLKVNEKTTRRSYDELQNGFLSDSILQFFSLPDSIFGKQTRTQFAWSRWDNIDGRRMEVFSLRVLARYSQLAFTNSYGSRVVGFHGLMYADPATQTMVRLELQLDLPSDFTARECSLDVDYGDVTIAEHHFLLPVKATARLRTPSAMAKNETQVVRYQKYAADASVTFGDQGDSK
jgi:hypothetical protein